MKSCLVVAESLTIAALAGLDRDAVEARIAAADDRTVVTLVDEITRRTLDRLSTEPAGRARFVVRIVIVERRDLYERDLVWDGSGWSIATDVRGEADVVSRWQGLVPIVWCETGELLLAAAVAVGFCQSEGAVESQELLARILATADRGNPLAHLYLARGLPDRAILATLESIDMQGLLRAMCEVGAQISRHGLGLGQRESVVQVDVPLGGRTYIAQTITTSDGVAVRDGTPEPPTVVIRFRNAIDFARTCTGERTAVELIAAGAVELVGDLAVFAQFDRIRF